MKTAGSLLQEARLKQEKSLEHVARSTRIKEKFLLALEVSDWAALPNFPVAQGFARSYASVVNVNPDLVVALLRRDFPQYFTGQKTQEMSLRSQPVWTPRTTILSVAFAGTLLVSIYLGRQYLVYAAPPPLTVNVVQVDQKISVSGKTSPSATIEVNGRPVIVDGEGEFDVELEKQDLINSLVEVQSVSRSGKKTVIRKPMTLQTAR